LNSLTADLRVGVLSGDDAAGDAGGDDSVGAGAGAAMMTAGLEGDVGGGAAGREASGGGLFESDDLGVVAVVVEVRALADDFGCAASGGRLGEDTAYLGVRGGEADALAGKREGPLHEDFVLSFFMVVRHIFRHCF